jgi:hypothetical protein
LIDLEEEILSWFDHPSASRKLEMWKWLKVVTGWAVGFRASRFASGNISKYETSCQIKLDILILIPDYKNKDLHLKLNLNNFSLCSSPFSELKYIHVETIYIYIHTYIYIHIISYCVIALNFFGFFFMVSIVWVCTCLA